MAKSRKVIRRPKPDTDVLFLQECLQAQGYFREQQPCEGIFCDITDTQVKVFQSQHLGEDKQPLSIDGVVGGKTWWALENPSGPEQRSGAKAIMPEGLTPTRQILLELLLEEHGKDVHEVPNGSNASADIDRYWGRTGLRALPWCCAFVSWALNETLGFLPIGNKHHVGVMAMWRNARRENMNVSLPKPGDVFVQDLGGGKGHTGFVVSVSADEETLYTCEGNSGNRLKLGKRNITTINHFIDAVQDEQNDEFERRDYSLADLKNKSTR